MFENSAYIILNMAVKLSTNDEHLISAANMRVTWTDLLYLLLKFQSLEVGVAVLARTPPKFERLRPSFVEPDVSRLLSLIDLLLRRISGFSPKKALILDQPVVKLIQSFELIVTSSKKEKRGEKGKNEMDLFQLKIKENIKFFFQHQFNVSNILFLS